MFDRYNDHAESRNSYKFQKYNWKFNQTFCYAYCGFVHLYFLGDDPAMIINMNTCFWHVFNTQNHTLPFNIQLYS